MFPSVLPEWLPEAVKWEAERLSQKFVTTGQIGELSTLARLILDDRMKTVWKRLYSRKRQDHRPTALYVYPAMMTKASHAAHLRRKAAELFRSKHASDLEEAELKIKEAQLLESEPERAVDQRWTEQDRGVQRFLELCCIDLEKIKPVFKADLDKRAADFSTLAKMLNDAAKRLKTLQPKVSKDDVRQLRDLASDCDFEARRILSVDLRTDDPWVIQRKRGDAKIRSYVADLSIATANIFGRRMHGTLAIIASVAFQHEVKQSEIRDWLNYK